MTTIFVIGQLVLNFIFVATLIVALRRRPASTTGNVTLCECGHMYSMHAEALSFICQEAGCRCTRYVGPKPIYELD